MRIIVLACLMLLPLAQAGSPDAPEVEDPDGDGTDLDPENARDIVKGWVEEGEGFFRFHAELAADPTHIFASLNGGSEVIRFGFRPSGLALADGQESYVRLRFGVATGTGDAGDEVTTCRYGVAAEDAYQDILQQVDLAAGFSGATFWCDVPYDLIGHEGATTFSNLHMDAHFISRGPLTGAPPAGGDNIPPTEVHHYDRAPDAGYGSDVTFSDAPESVPVTYLDSPLPIANATAEATTARLQYNWTGAATIRIQAIVEAGNLSLALSVQNETVMSWNGTGLDDVVSDQACLDAGVEPADCTYALLVDMQDFIGSFSVGTVEQPDEDPGSPAEPGAGDETPEMPQENETIDDAPAGKESPGVVAPLGLLAVALAAMRRR